MRIVTCNVNGIRSAAKKGFFHWAKKLNSDFICLQETKAQLAKLQHDALELADYHRLHVDAKKPGYSGVAIYTPHKPLKVIDCLGWKCADEEGRYLQIDYNNFSIISLYLPSGTSGEHRQAEKYNFMELFTHTLLRLLDQKKSIVICGDWNIAHKNIDLKNWRANQKNSGFLPEERAWLDKVFNELGWIDAFRAVNQEADQYTWWSNRGQAWAKNVGWRIDYQIISPDLRDKIRNASIYKDQRFSDHAPLIVDYHELRLS